MDADFVRLDGEDFEVLETNEEFQTRDVRDSVYVNISNEGFCVSATQKEFRRNSSLAPENRLGIVQRLELDREAAEVDERMKERKLEQELENWLNGKKYEKS